jgi:hypothetical protein
MNVDLLENAVKYHGKGLFDLILEKNNCSSGDEGQNGKSLIVYDDNDSQNKILNYRNHTESLG